MDLTEFIKNKRPSLSASSIKTYNSVLTSLYKKVFDYSKGDKIDTDKFNETSKILKYLEELPPNRRKTILSALVVITDKKEYREGMLDDINNYNADIKKQEKTESQKENWVENDELNNIYLELKRNAELLYKKSHLVKNDYQQIQNYILIALLGGFFCPPRRSLDYASFKIKNIDKENDNYIDKSSMVFNRFKTAKTYGKQRIKINPALKAILNKWIKINPTDYLLFDSNMNPLSSVKITQRLNKIFGKKASVNQMRHTYLTGKYGEMIKQNNGLANDLSAMGSSMNMATTYIKNED
jgi:integrase